MSDGTSIDKLASSLRTTPAAVTDIFAALAPSASGIAQVDLDGRLLDINASLSTMLGYPREELIGQAFTLIVHPDDVQEHIDTHQKLITGDTAGFRTERRFLRHDKTVFWANHQALLIKRENNIPDGLIVLVEDISERKRLEDEKQAIELYHKLLFNQLPDSVILLDTDTNIVGYNDEALRTYEYSPEEILRLQIKDLTVAHNKDQVEAIKHRLLVAGKDDFFSRHKTKSGRLLDIKVSIRRIDLPNGETVFQCVFHDITESRRRKEALKHSEERLRQATRASRTGIFDHDHITDVLYWSPEMRKILGLGPDEPASLDAFLEQIHQEDRQQVADAVLRVHDPQTGGGMFKIEYRWVQADGEVRWLMSRAEVFMEGEGADRRLIRTVGAVNDITERKQVENSLRESRERLALATRAGEIGIWDWDLDSGVIIWDDTMYRLYGLRRGDFPIVYDVWKGRVHPDEIAREEAKILSSIKEGQSYDTEFRVVRPNGDIRHIKSYGELVFDDTGRVRRVVGTNWDITDRKQSEEALRESHERLQRALEASNTGTWRVDLRTSMDTRDASLNRMLGLPAVPTTQPLADWFSYLHPDDLPEIREAWDRGMESGVYEVEHRVVLRDGAVRWVYDRGVIVRDATQQPQYAIGATMDITEKKRQDALIWTQANYDPLTNLPNRRLFQDRLEVEIRKFRRTKTPVALLLIDLDRFKEINDTLGHAKGDVLLIEAARRIGACVRETDTVARLGGDEFTVILPGFADKAHVERVAQHIIEELSKPFSLGNRDIGYISATVGITVYPDDATDFESLMKHADQAMYRAKGEGRSRFGYFTPSMQQEAQEKRTLTDDLRQALAKGELVVHYQPIIDMKTGDIVKAEALLRWNHTERGMISPTVFIPLAEETRLIVEIGEWVFREACTRVDQWRKEFGKIIPVCINKSPVQFEFPVEKEWSDILAAHSLPGDSITVEITEGLLLKESPKVKHRLLQFRNCGIEVAIDDFGTGFSSLSYLKRFDIDYLKVDRSFVRFLGENDSDQAVVEAIIVMAHKLGIRTVAEGVETQAQHDLLTSSGCDFAQGFLYSPAVPPRELAHLLRGDSILIS